MEAQRPVRGDEADAPLRLGFERERDGGAGSGGLGSLDGGDGGDQGVFGAPEQRAGALLGLLDARQQLGGRFAVAGQASAAGVLEGALRSPACRSTG